MSLLNAAKIDETITTETDSVGGGGVWETALYPVEITMAYLEKKASGAVFMNVICKNDAGQEYKEGLCLASGDAKGNKNFYETANGEKKYLPGFNHANSLSLLTVGKNLAELDTDLKIVNIYSFEAKKEVGTEVEVVMGLLGQRAILGLQKQIVDKNAKGDDGKYHATGETRESNEIDKIFREKDHMTTAEILAQADAPVFYTTWEKKWTGKTRNKATAANDANGGTAGAPSAAKAGGTPKPTKSLFG
jgi:hypothetical protein